ncbi:MAG: TetR/AcrR family transcriptional regulator C-terminal domain-containing protein [Actinobacteria bacterium]|nr:TetR/AcrR family transcriptional regulator C-terminal domain-containing protein [Actinomycetota bacterium]
MTSPEDLAPAIDDADVAAVAGLVPPSAREPLTKERIVDAAVVFIDANGLPGLTMRRLGNELGVEAMALYRHVPGKEALLDAVVETLIEGMQRDDDVLDSPRDGWQDFMIRLAHGVRRVALEHPKAFPLVVSRPPEAPWLRPPLRSLAWVEAFLEGLVDEGFTDEAAVAAYRAYTSFLLGNLLLEVSAHGADLGPLDVLDDGTGDDDAVRAHPTVRRVRALLSEDHANAEFEEALEALVKRLSLLRAEHLST